MTDEGLEAVQTTAQLESGVDDVARPLTAARARPGLVVLFPRDAEQAPLAAKLRGQVIVGRGAEAQLSLRDAAVSRVHARLELAAAGVRVTDLGSRHGTFVDGEKVGKEGIVADFGSILRVGGTLVMPVPDVDAHATPPRVVAAHFLGLSRDLIAGPSYAHTLDEAARLAPLPTPVLIRGESGTGKEGVARMIHASSGRPGAFVGINIAAVPDNLFESEMFGHTRGAFTGAESARLGAFREAEGGTIFLDEIADLRPDLQVKLLRVLDLQQVRPLGGKAEQRIDVRFVAATHRDLDRLCAAGTFRLDLYYRLRGAVLRVAPLRARRDEVVLLALDAIREQREELTLSVEAAEALATADWEGNVRNLNRAVTEAVCNAVASKDVVVRRRHLPDLAPVTGDAEPVIATRQITNAMAESEGNATRAAKLLGISRVTLYRVCKRLNLDITEARARQRSRS